MERLRGVIPFQPDDRSHVWGVNSFAALPMFGGMFCEDVAQQRGYRMPVAYRQETGARSGLCVAAVDPDATVTAPAVASYEREEAAGGASSEASKNADVLGKVFVKRLGDCAEGPDDTQVCVENAKGYAERFALEAGFRRCASRVGVPNTRAV